MIEEPAKLTLITSAPRPSAAQIAAFQGVETGFVVDAMNGKGAMAAKVAPLGFGRDLVCVAAGPALVADNGPGDILATLAAIEMVKEGDIVVATAVDHQGCAAAGDRVTGMMKNAGAAGFVTDGPMRDYDGIVAVGLPSWCTGLHPNSPFVSGPGITGGSAIIGGIQVCTGDMIVADRNGVVVVPHALIDDVIGKLDEVRRLEHELEAKVANGFCTPLDLEAMLESGEAKSVS